VSSIVVVEGVHDRAAVRPAVDVDVICTGGFDFGPDVVARLQRGQQTRGLVVLTDPDHAGEQIRRRIEELVGPCAHARVPRDACRRRGRLGVEYASRDTIRRALEGVRSSVPAAASPFTAADLRAHGLEGHPAARARREALGKALSIGYANAKQLLVRLKALGVTRAEFEAAVAEL